ncbi:MAG: tetratricopeptide repeat protein [Chitinophagales bacterium]|nr:tetratricopeptide repeat protein [Chitinophagales bacterium]
MSASSYPRYLLIITLVIYCTEVSFAKAQEHIVDSLKHKLAKTHSDTAKADVLIELGYRAVCEQRLDYLEDALDISRKAEYQKGIMNASYKIGFYYSDCRKNYITAIEWSEKSLALARAQKDVQYQFKAYNQMADCYKNMADYGKALACYKHIIDLDIDRDNIIQTLGNTGVVYQDMGEYANALDNYQKAYNLLYQDIVEADTPTVYDTLTLLALKYQIANIYFAIPDYERAEASYREVQELNRKLQALAFNMLSNLGIGDCYLNKKLYSNAIANYKNAETLLNNSSEATGDEYLVQTYYKLGETYLGMHKLDSADYYAGKAFQIASGTGDSPRLPILLPRVYTTMGKIFSARKKYDDAIGYLKKAVALSKETGAMDIESTALLTLSRTYEKMNRTADALHTYQQHIALRDSMLSRKKIQELTRIDMQGYFDRQQFADSMKVAEEKKIARLQLQRQRILTYSGFGAILLLLLLSFFIFRSYQHQKKANVLISHARDSISREKQVSEQLLLNILPEEVADELKQNGRVSAQLFDNVTVMFTDFVDFTLVGEQLSPQELVAELDTCFKAFDHIIDKYDIEKIKTVGDAYLAVSGLPLPNANHATEIIAAAIEIVAYTEARKKELGERTFSVRVGINSGSVVAGIVGMKKFAYDIWSDTVNIAARMEQTGAPGRINISEDTYLLVKDQYICTYRGEIAAKNKGELKMYFVEGKA